jgi:GNAT superfamily N-acetyltransferase
MKAFLDALMKSKKELFDDVYGDHQLHLGMICTLPDYQRRGAGTMQCKWGLDLAKEKKLEVTLFASPMGRLLYEHLGFDVRGTVIVQVKGEEEKLTIKAMAYDTPGRSLVVKLLAHVWNLFSMRFYTIQRDDI